MTSTSRANYAVPRSPEDAIHHRLAHTDRAHQRHHHAKRHRRADCGAQGAHCTTLLLDDIMADLPGAFRRIARAFRLADVDRLAAPLAAGAVERAFLDACGPESTFVASKKDGSATARDAGSHRTGPDAERAGRLATLRDIDAVYLGGRLAAANATLRRHLR